MDNIGILENKIITAFTEVAYPGDSKLTYDEYGGEGLGDSDCAAVKGAFVQKTWQEILPVLQNPYFQNSLYCLSCEAFPYYLPAYLVTSLKYYETELLLFDALLSNLTPSRHKPLFYYMISLLTEEQEDVIADFLKYMKTEAKCHHDEYAEKDIDVALKEYWGLPLQKRRKERAKLRGSIFVEITRIIKTKDSLSIVFNITNLSDQDISIFLNSIHACLDKLTIYERHAGRWSLKRRASLTDIGAYLTDQRKMIDLKSRSNIEYTVQLPTANFVAFSTHNYLDNETIINGKKWGYNLQGEVRFLKGKTRKIYIEKVYDFNRISIEVVV